MVDVFEQIYNQLYTDIIAYADTISGKEVLSDRIPTIKTSYQENTTEFPYITIEEKDNRFAGAETDSYEKFSYISYEINFYDNSVNKIKVCRALANVCDENLSKKIGLKRTFQQAIPNVLDGSIYRIVQKRDGYIDNDSGIVYTTQPRL